MPQHFKSESIIFCYTQPHLISYFVLFLSIFLAFQTKVNNTRLCLPLSPAPPLSVTRELSSLTGDGTTFLLHPVFLSPLGTAIFSFCLTAYVIHFFGSRTAYNFVHSFPHLRFPNYLKNLDPSLPSNLIYTHSAFPILSLLFDIQYLLSSSYLSSLLQLSLSEVITLLLKCSYVIQRSPFTFSSGLLLIS